MVEEGHVEGWDDPRMPTLAAFRRRGYTAAAIRDCMARVGVTKKQNVTELGFFENCVREDLNESAPRRFAVLKPLKLIIENYPAGEEEWLDAANHPTRPEFGSRQIPFADEILIEQEDFAEDPPSKFFRLKPGGEVRLRYAYIVKCERVEKDADGNVVAVYCSYDPATRGGDAIGRKVKGTIHWVSARHAITAEVRLYDRLFKVPNPTGDDLAAELNEGSLVTVSEARLEPALAAAESEAKVQFERLGYFSVDPKLSQPGTPVFNRVVTLRDSWAKIEQQAVTAGSE
jgi:glutaminyl-tRNA synthetase